MDTTASARAQPQPNSSSKQYDLEATIISAKHIKNVNWKTGDLKPYSILWIDPDRRQATKPDEHSSTKPTWNERFIFPLNPHTNPIDSILTIEIYHSKPSETPKPLVGSTRFEIRNLFNEPTDKIYNLQLKRPSGRPQGKIRVRLSLIERIVFVENNSNNNYQSAPPINYYYQPPSSPGIPPGNHYSSYGHYSRPVQPPPPYSYGYYPGYHSGGVTPPNPRYMGGYGGVGPSAPVDYTPNDYGNRVTGAFGGLRLDEGETRGGEEKVFERVGSDVASISRDVRYGDYRSEY